MQPTNHASSTMRGWLVCTCSALFWFYEFMQLSLMDSISSDMMQAFNMSESTLAEVSAAYLLAIVLFYFPVGYLFDRFSSRRLILIGTALGTVAALAFAKSTNVYIAEIARFVSGFSHCLAFLGCMRIAAHWLPDKLGAIMGWNVTIGLLGGVVAHTPFTYFVTVYGWRDALVINSLLGIIIFVLIYFIVYDSPGNKILKQKAQTHGRSFIQNLRIVISNPQNWFCACYTCLLNLPVMLLGALWGILFLTQQADVTRIEASNIIAMIFYGTIIGSPIVGYLSEKMQSRKKPMILGAALSILIVGIIFLIPDPSYMTLISFYLLLGLITSTQIISYPAITESNPGSICGVALSFCSIIIMGGGGLGQKIFGYILEIDWQSYFPHIGTNHYGIAFLMIPIGFILALIAALLMRESFNHKKIDQ